MTPDEFNQMVEQRTGQPPIQPQPQPIEQPPQKRWSFQNFMRGMSNITGRRPQQPRNNSGFEPRARLSSEQIRQNIKMTNLLSGSAWNDRSNRGRISLMGSDRDKQNERNMTIQYNNFQPSQQLNIEPNLKFWH